MFNATGFSVQPFKSYYIFFVQLHRKQVPKNRFAKTAQSYGYDFVVCASAGIGCKVCYVLQDITLSSHTHLSSNNSNNSIRIKIMCEILF